MTRLAELYIAVDWSAANQPVKGKDSIWIAAKGLRSGQPWRLVENIPTRREAENRLVDLIRLHLNEGHRVLAGFDFAFGYPAGFAKALTGQAGWQPVWTWLSNRVMDDAHNRSNRFEVAEGINQELGEPVLWGKPHQHRARYPLLPSKKPVGGELDSRRLVERHVPQAKSVFQLAYNGAVGSQTLLGLPMLNRLRTMFSAKVWPFETAFVDAWPNRAGLVLAEIYPTLVVARAKGDAIKDKQQVEMMVDTLSRCDHEGYLGDLLSPPPGVLPNERSVMLREEGSILGAGVL